MKQFSPPHLAALGVLALAALASVWIARTNPGRPTRVWARLLALAIFAGWAGEYVADAVQGIWSGTRSPARRGCDGSGSAGGED